MPVKLATVVGARPQFVKAAVVSRVVAARSDLSEVLIHTGQHYDEGMSGVFFSELGIPAPTYDLKVGSGLHGEMTGRMLEGVERVLLAERPDWVLVYGDTNSTLAGALAAVKLHIPVAHVEAGLRSFNRRMPEEVNRVLTDHVSALLFAPTDAAVRNLVAEGIGSSMVHQVGDLMYDASLFYARAAEARSRILGEAGLERGGFVLVTIHRADNTDCPDRLQAIVGGMLEAARDVPIVWPLHPRTAAALERAGLAAVVRAALRVLPPVGYLDMIELERNARLVVTDSGGVQKEAFFCGVPCVTLRDETEWVELVVLGANRLVPPTSAAAVAEAVRTHATFPATAGSPYGDGHAGVRIVDALLRA